MKMNRSRVEALNRSSVEAPMDYTKRPPNRARLGVYKCPPDRSVTVRVPKVPRNRSYRLNTLLSGNILNPIWALRLKTKTTQIVSPPATR